MVTALVVKGKREMGAKPGSVLPTAASKTGILYAPMVERFKTRPFQGRGRGSIPLGSTNMSSSSNRLGNQPLTLVIGVRTPKRMPETNATEGHETLIAVFRLCLR